jgi:hypothetical protein
MRAREDLKFVHAPIISVALLPIEGDKKSAKTMYSQASPMICGLAHPYTSALWLSSKNNALLQ